MRQIVILISPITDQGVFLQQKVVKKEIRISYCVDKKSFPPSPLHKDEQNSDGVLFFGDM